MFNGQISKTISLIIIFAMMNMLIGCNTSKPPTSGIAPNNGENTGGKFESNDFFDEIDSEIQTPEFNNAVNKSFDLPNGTLITVTNFDIRNDYYVVRLDYDNGTARVTRDAVISPSFTELHLYDMLGNKLYHYAVELTEDSTAIKFTYDTQQEQLFITHFADEVRQKYDFMGEVVDISFTDEEQMNRAIWLYQTYNEENKSGLSPEDLALYNNMAEVDAIVSTNTSLDNNLDVIISGYLVGHQPIIEWVISNEAQPILAKLKLPKWFKKLCHIAGYAATISCPFFWTGWGAAICVPAVGISITCEVLFWLDDDEE